METLETRIKAFLNVSSGSGDGDGIKDLNGDKVYLEILREMFENDIMN